MCASWPQPARSCSHHQARRRTAWCTWSYCRGLGGGGGGLVSAGGCLERVLRVTAGRAFESAARARGLGGALGGLRQLRAASDSREELVSAAAKGSGRRRVFNANQPLTACRGAWARSRSCRRRSTGGRPSTRQTPPCCTKQVRHTRLRHDRRRGRSRRPRGWGCTGAGPRRRCRSGRSRHWGSFHRSPARHTRQTA